MEQATHVGPHTLAEFDASCRQIVVEMARGIQADVGSGSGIEVISKPGYDGVADGDLTTTADLNSQQRLVEFDRHQFPEELGLIGEENNLRRPSTLPKYEIILTADPLDGTKVFAEAVGAGRVPGKGAVSAMLGVLIDGVPAAGYVCDVNDLTLYTCAPYGDTVWQIDEQGNAVDMATLPRASSLATGTLLLHGRRDVTDPLGQELLSSAFGKVVPESAGIGLAATRVLTGELVGFIRGASGYFTPWDDTPVQAMCRQGGIVVLKMCGDRFREVKIGPLDEVTLREDDLLYIAHHYLGELERFGPVIRL